MPGAATCAAHRVREDRFLAAQSGSAEHRRLVTSVREHRIQQPIKARPQGSRFEIVYGERRFLAARKVGLTEIPATVEELSDREAHAIRIVDNICPSAAKIRTPWKRPRRTRNSSP